MIGINGYQWHESCLQLQYLLTSEEMQRLTTHNKWLNTLRSTTCCSWETRAEIGCVLGQRQHYRILTES
eukprot:4945440-Ditylum_brightwellii.AAC.1